MPYSFVASLDPGFSLTRMYVDSLADKIELSDHIYKGEESDSDLSGFSDEYIERKLKERISDSSVTIVLISPNMRVNGKADRDQWIPWEISYSLKEVTRDDRTSHTNALLGVVLPDENGLYDYCVAQRNCCETGCRKYETGWTFAIISENTFNKKQASPKICDNGDSVYTGEYSYMPIVTWDELIQNPTMQIERACKLRDEHFEEYNVRKVI